MPYRRGRIRRRAVSQVTAVLGIDPGIRGGLAILKPNGEIDYIRAFRPDWGRHELIMALNCATDLLLLYQRGACFIENVGYIRGDGAKGSFTFGNVAGLIEGHVRTKGITPEFVYPAIWQSKMRCLSHGDKNVTKRRAAELYPNENWTHATSDAVLIARYGQILLEEYARR